MTTDPPTDVELEWLRTPHPDQLDLETTPPVDRNGRDHVQENQQ